MNNSRKENRYSTCSLNPERAYIEINSEKKIRARIVDLSAGGLAFEITGDEEEIQALDRTRSYSIEIVIDSLRIPSSVQRAWGIIKTAGSTSVLLSGVRFETISRDDRLRLYGVIERVREMSLGTS